MDLQKKAEPLVLSVCPETTYAWAMRLMLFGFTTSGIITFGYTKPDMSHDPVLEVYGLVNACITFDYSPAREFMAVALVFVCALIMLHTAFFVQRLRVYFGSDSCITKAGKMIGPLYVVMFSCIAISLIIRPNESIMGHTMPYEVLIIGSCIWWTFNCVVVTYWPYQLPARAVNLWWASSVVFSIVSILKIYVQQILMAANRNQWDKLTLEQYLPSWFPSSALDPIWMFLFIFYGRFHPLHNKRIQLAISDCNEPAERGAASICCMRIVEDGKGKDVISVPRASDKEDDCLFCTRG